MIYLFAAAVIVGVLAYIAYRANLAGAGEEGVAPGSERRREDFLKLSKRSPVELIEDPREAAVVAMLVVAGVRGPVNDAQLAVISDAARGVMGVERPDDLIARGKWLAGHVTNPQATIDRFAPLFADRLDPAEREELIAALDKVATADGPATDTQGALVERLAKRL